MCKIYEILDFKVAFSVNSMFDTVITKMLVDLSKNFNIFFKIIYNDVYNVKVSGPSFSQSLVKIGKG